MFPKLEVMFFNRVIGWVRKSILWTGNVKCGGKNVCTIKKQSALNSPVIFTQTHVHLFSHLVVRFTYFLPSTIGLKTIKTWQCGEFLPKFRMNFISAQVLKGMEALVGQTMAGWSHILTSYFYWIATVWKKLLLNIN